MSLSTLLLLPAEASSPSLYGLVFAYIAVNKLAWEQLTHQMLAVGNQRRPGR